MTNRSPNVAREEALLDDARDRGRLPLLGAFIRLSGPGWLQSAITLGGGSLAAALYLGVLTGTNFLWVQVFAMALGVIALGAISWITLTTGENPFTLLKDRVSPVLAWGWLGAVMLANVVWALPQFSLATAAVEQNLLPGLKGDALTVITCLAVLSLSLVVVWAYGRGGRGVRIVELGLRVLVGLIVLAFFGVAWVLLSRSDGMSLSQVFAGFIPNLDLLSQPAPAYAAELAAARFPDLWSGIIVRQQQEVLIAAAATAVGINMTFLMPCSLLRRGWNRSFRNLAVFDLATGLLIPFVFATGCIVVASADRFHARVDQELVSDVSVAVGRGAYLDRLDNAIKEGFGAGTAQYEEHSIASSARAGLSEAELLERVGLAMNLVPEPDRRLASMLEKRDTFALARALEPLTGYATAHMVFGFGVLAMAVSTVIVLMLISGLAFAVAFRQQPGGVAFRWGTIVAGLGALGPFVWTGKARAWLAVPTSNFGMILLPLAYWSFVLLMNSRRVLGDDVPKGRTRWIWNSLLVPTALVASCASAWTVHMKLGPWGLAGLAAMAIAVLATLRRS
jgi:hypothetical protein